MGLFKSARDLNKMRSNLQSTVSKFRLERESEAPGSVIRQKNLLDLLIRSNEEAKKNGDTNLQMTKNDIYQNIMAFIVAGGDTSRATSSNLVHHLSHNLKHQATARSAVKRLVKFSPESEWPSEFIDYGSDSYLNAFFTETFRILGPA
jgi:cytochrome P450